jgi:hypothetical protein
MRLSDSSSETIDMTNKEASTAAVKLLRHLTTNGGRNGKSVLTTAGTGLTIAVMAKEEIVYARISIELKRKLAREMERRGEAEAVIIREALNEFFARRDAHAASFRETPVTYGKPKPKRRRKDP